MFELIGALGGGLFRFLPLLVDFFKQKGEQSHELALLTVQVEMEKQRGINRESEIAAMTRQAEDTSWAQGLADAVKNAIPPPLVESGNSWLNFLNGLNSSVRPMLTYWWCIILYSAAKIVLVLGAYQEHMSLTSFAPILLTEFDRGIVGSIIGFWFMDRAIRKAAGK